MAATSLPIDLSPARWIWVPSQRTLANTFILFRRALNITSRLRRASGFISADSRYRLTVNGHRVQWGPAPCDPRWLEADPIDLTNILEVGENVIGAEVLFYGSGDGTSPLGKPGFIFRLDLEYVDGRREQIISDQLWQCCIDRAHRPGQYRRWYLRALQEEFDARLHPEGWDLPSFTIDRNWRPAMVLGGGADKPSLCSSYPEYSSDVGAGSAECQLRRRPFPMLTETCVPVRRLEESARVVWYRDPEDWFQFRTPDAFSIVRQSVATNQEPGCWQLPASPDDSTGMILTFEFTEQMVGWPYIKIDAPAGTIIELMTQEAHDPLKTAWLDTHFYSWTRLICREGINYFECFDYESLRWLQLHIRNASRPVTVMDVGMRRRAFPWPAEPGIRCSEPALQRLFDANLNTLRNSVQETVVDGMGRERQQYSGDCGHQLHAVRYAYGEMRVPARYLSTFSQGQTLDGYFLDCWPAYDRLARIMQRQVGATGWGPLLDHGIGLNFDCWHHYMESGDLEPLREPYPRLLKFARYLESIRDSHGLLPVENIGVPAVWIDHDAYRAQRHKQCSFNLYAAAMLQHALAPIARAFGQEEEAKRCDSFGKQILASSIARFWSPERGVFVNNLPWLSEEKGIRLCDRSLATAILYDLCPNGNTAAALKALAECPPEMGLSYPANAGWRLWALAQMGRIDVVLSDFRRRWANLRSVIDNNALQEAWDAQPDTVNQFSHCPVVPLYVLFMDIAGIRPLSPGFAKVAVRPQLGDLPDLHLTAHTVRGPVRFDAQRQGSGHQVDLTLPDGCEAELWLPAGTRVALPSLGPDQTGRLHRFQLPTGRMVNFLAPMPARV